MIRIAKSIYLRIAKNFPSLVNKLRIAGIQDTPDEFVKKTLITALYASIGLLIISFFLLSKNEAFLMIVAIMFPLAFLFSFMYFLKLPDVKIIKKRKAIDREIVFAGRFLIIELSSGVLLYQAMSNVSKSYDEIGKSFNLIIHNIDLGTPLEVALNEAIENTPSSNLKKLLWQIMNALSTGADISKSLGDVIEQITKEQIIEIKNYAKKLNPLSMFYMVIAVILPSLGITMMIIMSSFISFQLELPLLIGLSGLLGLLQFMFYVIIKSQRPAVSL